MSPGKLAELLAVLVLGTLAAASAILLLRAVRSGEKPRMALAALLAVLCVDALWVWPEGLRAEHFPLLFARLAAPVPALLAARTQSDRALRWCGYLVAALGAALVALSLVRIHPNIGNVDFFCFVCTARDLLDGASAELQKNLVYFPGVYLFWMAALTATARALSGLQWWVASVLLLDALLCALVVRRGTRSTPLALIAGCLELLVSFNVEGPRGTAEPLATIFFLAGAAGWAGLPLRGAAWRGLLLGAGLGAAIYCKQTAGLLSLGWLALWLSQEEDGPASFTVPAGAVLGLALLFVLHGGVPALRAGLGLASAYPRVGEFLPNFRGFMLGVNPLVPLALLCGAVWLLGRKHRREPALRLAGFLLIGSAAALYQFRTRDYPHYGLLALPGLLAGCTLIGHFFWTRIPEAYAPARRAGLAALLTLSLGKLCSTSLRYVETLHDWPYGFAAEAQLPTLGVKPGEQGFVMPPQRSAVHFLLGTRSAGWKHSYYWGAAVPGDALLAVQSPAVKFVVVRQGKWDRMDNQICRDSGCAEAIAALPTAGFHLAAQTGDVELWRR